VIPFHCHVRLLVETAAGVRLSGIPCTLLGWLTCCVLLLHDVSQALVDSVAAEGSLVNELAVRSVAMFDHEEVGSDSAQGAGGPVMRDTITRVARLLAQVIRLEGWRAGAVLCVSCAVCQLCCACGQLW
jgi:hypothetical protein